MGLSAGVALVPAEVLRVCPFQSLAAISCWPHNVDWCYLAGATLHLTEEESVVPQKIELDFGATYNVAAICVWINHARTVYCKAHVL